MAGGNYQKQFYLDYEAVLTHNESLSIVLRRQAKQLAEGAERMRKLEEKQQRKLKN